MRTVVKKMAFMKKLNFILIAILSVGSIAGESAAAANTPSRECGCPDCCPLPEPPPRPQPPPPPPPALRLAQATETRAIPIPPAPLPCPWECGARPMKKLRVPAANALCGCSCPRPCASLEPNPDNAPAAVLCGFEPMTSDVHSSEEGERT